jgi:hypothetical protein
MPAAIVHHISEVLYADAVDKHQLPGHEVNEHWPHSPHAPTIRHTPVPRLGSDDLFQDPLSVISHGDQEEVPGRRDDDYSTVFFLPSAPTAHHISEALYADTMDEHQVPDHEDDGAHAPEFEYNWNIEDDHKGIDWDSGEDQRGSRNDEDGGEDQQGDNYENEDQQGTHSDKDDEEKGQRSHPDCHYAQHLLPSPPHSHADSVVPVTVDGASGAVELLGERPNHIVVCRGNELVSITTRFPCGLHFIFFGRLEQITISLTITI